MNTLISMPGLLACGLLALTTAQGSTAGETEQPIQLPDMTVVTAARAEQSLAEALASVSIISREDIRYSVAQDLPELLRLQAGVDVVRTGPAGAQTSVFLRGGNSDHLLVLIDGVRVASPHTGSYAWELIPLAAIERVEIVRGPRAGLYGSDAMGGVIQIFTRQLDNPAARVTGGSFGSYQIEAGIGGEWGPGRHSLIATHRKTDGWSAQNPYGFSYHPDDDGLEVSAAGANGEFAVGSGRLQYRLHGSETETEFDQGVSEARQGLATLSWHGTASGHWDYQVQAGYFDDQLDSDYGFFSSGFDARRLDLGWHNQLNLSKGRLGFGLDYVDESGTSAGSYTADRDNRGAYLAWGSGGQRSSFELTGRLDDNSQFGSEFTWQAAAGVSVFDGGQVSLQWGTAFRAPDFGELFSPGFGGLFAGNTALQPESSDTVELNWRHDISPGLHYTVAAYRNDVDDLIAFSGDNFQAININEARIDGLEFEATARMVAWTVSGNLTWQRTEDKATGQSLLRRPDHKGSLTVDRHFANGSWLGADWFVSGSRLDVGGVQLPGYGIISLRGGWAISPSVTLELRLENLLDKAFEPARGFNGTARGAFLSLDWRG